MRFTSTTPEFAAIELLIRIARENRYLNESTYNTLRFSEPQTGASDDPIQLWSSAWEFHDQLDKRSDTTSKRPAEHLLHTICETKQLNEIRFLTKIVFQSTNFPMFDKKNARLFSCPRFKRDKFKALLPIALFKMLCSKPVGAISMQIAFLGIC